MGYEHENEDPNSSDKSNYRFSGDCVSVGGPQRPDHGFRKSGLNTVGDIRWGTHFCQFYNDQKEFFDIVAPYLKTGIEENEYCLMITSGLPQNEVAKTELRKRVPGFDKYLGLKQIDILPYTKWYLHEDHFSAEEVIAGWKESLDSALEKGFSGLRIAGDTAWVDKALWKPFLEYELEIGRIIHGLRMIALCTYPLRYGASEVIDVVSTHEFALVKREGKWESIENSEHRRMESELQKTNATIEALMEYIPEGITIADAPDVRVRMVSRFGKELAGRNSDEIEYIPIEEHSHNWDIFKTDGSRPSKSELPLTQAVVDGKTVKDQEFLIRKPDGETITVICNAGPIKNGGGKITGGVIAWRDITERKRMEEEQALLIGRLQEALQKVKTLSGLLPICASCKRIRDEKGEWKAIETYIKDRSDAEFTHSICDECARKIFASELPD